MSLPPMPIVMSSTDSSSASSCGGAVPSGRPKKPTFCTAARSSKLALPQVRSTNALTSSAAATSDG
ncbi:MAG: hypothetical protein V9E99_13200 [Microthrixaceae bacterium]